eukprot:5315440-Alexandrium_andersonii.AAC.1
MEAARPIKDCLRSEVPLCQVHSCERFCHCLALVFCFSPLPALGLAGHVLLTKSLGKWAAK